MFSLQLSNHSACQPVKIQANNDEISTTSKASTTCSSGDVEVAVGRITKKDMTRAALKSIMMEDQKYQRKNSPKPRNRKSPKNGDKQISTWVATGVAKSGAITGTWTHVGGTGRYQGATGGGTFHSLTDRKTGTFVNTVKGAILLN